MFTRIKKSGKYQYLQIVENRREKGKTKQRVIATLGRLDRLQESYNIESLVRSLSRFSKSAILVLTSSSNPNADALSIGPPLVFFDTTSLYFEGNGGETIGRKGHSKDHRPDLNQMIVGITLDDNGRPLCCEMWPGNTVDVKSLIPVTNRMRRRFSVANCCFVADRGMISKGTMKQLEEREIPYILGVRMRRVNEVKREALPQAVSFKPIYPEGTKAKDPDPLQVAEVVVNERRYIICFNPRQARKDAADRQAIVEKLKAELPKGTAHLIGNKGYRKYLKATRQAVTLDMERIETEAQFDGKYVLTTNTDWSAEQVALRYKELWRVEYAFRDVKSILETRPIYHQCDATIRGHVFCSFLALVLRHELDRHLDNSGYDFEWADVKQDISNLQEVTINENDQTLVIRTGCVGCCGKVFQSVGIAMPPTIREQ